MNQTDFSQRLTPPIIDSDSALGEIEDSAPKNSSQKSVRYNKFSLSHFFKPVAPSPTPSIHSESPSVNKWPSRFSNFVGSLFEKKESPSSFENLKVDSSDLGETIAYSSPQTIKVLSPVTISFDSLMSASGHSSTEEMTLPQQSFFEAGEQDRKLFAATLVKKVKELGATDDQLKKDIDRISYFLNGKRVQDVETIRSFFGEAADIILPVLSQIIPNIATDIIADRILQAAPVNTTHAELGMSDDKKNGTSINISKVEGKPDFHIEVETIGSPMVFLKKVEREGTPDFEVITLPTEDNFSAQTRFLGEGQQFIALELTKDDNGPYSISCSSLLRKYFIQLSHS